MASSAYNGFTISVQAVVAPIGNIRTALTKISITEGSDALVYLYSPSEFFTDHDAEAYGFQMAENWIDENLRAKPLPKREAVKVKTADVAHSTHEPVLRAKPSLSPR